MSQTIASARQALLQKHGGPGGRVWGADGEKDGEFVVFDGRFLFVYEIVRQGSQLEHHLRAKLPRPSELVKSFRSSTSRALHRGEVNAGNMASRWDELVRAVERYDHLLHRFLRKPDPRQAPAGHY